MIRFGYFLFLLMSAPALATDYIIRVETTGYVDAVVEENSPEPEERSLRTIETLCRLDEPFRARMTVSNETMTLSGVLRKSDIPDTDFYVEITHSHQVRDRESAPVGSPVNRKPVYMTSATMRLALIEGVSLKHGGLLSSSTTATDERSKPLTKKSKMFCIVTVEEYDPNLTKVKSP